MALENQAVNLSIYKKQDSAELIYRYNMIRAKLGRILKRPDDIIRKYKNDNSDFAHYASSVALYRKSIN